ncbi:hypothetical protein CHARACLAT_000442 [Characodon lateralis]|uniref:Uncharacterized protein n=1 Tax=Characodon lateralis TaxID=208331 RepID=A0ABU7CJC8_9TELE|nr:hypothetical protein [Characodon lateralis]
MSSSRPTVFLTWCFEAGWREGETSCAQMPEDAAVLWSFITQTGRRRSSPAPYSPHCGRRLKVTNSPQQPGLANTAGLITTSMPS